ncbi:MAG TPA: DUF1697 domain-containing protein [bacterium]|nr:DUF1697 domain-containing protein [bacterium]
MKFIALLRGINVGKSVQINMDALKQLLLENGFLNVASYINSGNLIFEANRGKDAVKTSIEEILRQKYAVDIKVLVKTPEEMKAIIREVPAEWKNNSEQKTDVAYLFDAMDAEAIAKELPIKREYTNIRIAEGAIIWNIRRENLNKSQLSKIISHKIYQEMTVRNINTARKLALM